MEKIEMKRFGRDHWSTLAYIETRCVDHKGVPGLDQMRCNPDEHPGLCGRGGWSGKYSSKLKDGSQVEGHDDWHCVEDLEREGLLRWEGTGMHPIFVLTDKGWKVAGQLRRHLAEGKGASKFSPEV